MRLPFFARDNTECPAGTQYYTCAASSYKGCCSVDACDYAHGCPDGVSTGAPSATAKSITAHNLPTLPPSTSSTSTSTSSSSSSSSSSTHQTSSSSTTSATTGTSAAAPPAKESGVSGGDGNQGSTHSLSKSAIGGIVTAGVIAFIVLFGIFLWRMRRHNKHLKQVADAAQSAAQQQPPAPGSVFPQPTPSPANPQGTPGLDEKFGGATVSQRDNLLANDANVTVNAKLAELQGTSPASTTVPLFGEAPTGNLEDAIAQWGLYGARLMAQQKSRLQGLANTQSAETVADYGGGYLGPGSEPGLVPLPLQVGPRIAELDGQRPAVVAELETPQPTPMSTPGIGSYSPSLSVGSSNIGRRSTIVSPWRNSSRTVNSDVNTITEEGVDASGTTPGGSSHVQRSPLPSPSLQPPHSPSRSGSTTEGPRATLDLSQTERRRGVNVTSWGSYNP